MSKVLVIAPHADDEVLGMGGTMARFADEGNNVVVGILTGHGEETHPIWPEENWEIVRREALEAHSTLGVQETLFREIPAVLVAEEPVHKVNEVCFELIEAVSPEILFIPFIYDLHRDHREIVYSCSVSWRTVSKVGRGIREIYMYETLSETHLNIQPQEAGFLPNTYIDISEKYLSAKLKALSFYKSQIQPFPDARSLEAIEALAKFRGSTVGVKAAESFILTRKII